MTVKEIFLKKLDKANYPKSGMATISQLLKKIGGFDDKDELRKWLEKVGMIECYYQNEVDDLIVYKMTGEIPQKFKSATDFLKGIGAL